MGWKTKRVIYRPDEGAFYLKIALNPVRNGNFESYRSYRIPLNLLTSFIPHEELFFLGVRAVEIYLRRKFKVKKIEYNILEEECVRLLRNGYKRRMEKD
ncbi:hypothetical protein DRN63_02890 [Nanoarchaeota archaeon]|nr:MAG: hypothetical protein DRN63_02890 [Nanoarchaeota archaeon]